MIQKRLIICPYCKYNVFWDTQRDTEKRIAWSTFMCSNWDCYYFDSFETPINLRSHEKVSVF